MSKRHAAAAGSFLLLLAVFAGLLWNLQIISGAAYYEKSQQSIAQIETVPAARGKLLDRKGRILAQDTTSWAGTVDSHCAPEVLDRLLQLCREEGIPWTGEGPMEDVTSRFLARVTEEELTGVSFSPVAARQSSGSLAPHLLGRVGPMSPQEWALYQNKGYAMDARVGKDGAEAAFESFLRGIPGTKIIQKDRAGRVVSETYRQQPQPGKNVTLTLDRDLQKTAKDIAGKAVGSAARTATRQLTRNVLGTLLK